MAKAKKDDGVNVVPIDPKSNVFECHFADLAKDLATLTNLKKEIDSPVGALRSNLKHIQEQQGYHPKALAIIRDFDNMAETKLADVLRTFIPMLDAMRAGKWDALRQDMIDEIG